MRAVTSLLDSSSSLRCSEYPVARMVGPPKMPSGEEPSSDDVLIQTALRSSPASLPIDRQHLELLGALPTPDALVFVPYALLLRSREISPCGCYLLLSSTHFWITLPLLH
ncbi:hypothetical protein BV20DRAFT_363556 [Pilatotrama ljubarskyi]|nr:hypothetical protein BV20DRAFT_363556 [Pilatotrama ljubarskyi]